MTTTLAARSSHGLKLSLSGACHLGMLALIADYLLVYYPAGQAAVLGLMLAAVISEMCPAAWKRWLFGELLLVAAGVASYLMLVDADDDSRQGWIRMLLAYWLLVPSRQGLLRWSLSLVAAELLILGAEPARFHDLPIGHWPVFGKIGIPTPLFWLLPIGLASLGLDAWLRGTGAVRGHGNPRARGDAALRWVAFPCALILVPLLVGGPALMQVTKRVPPKFNGPAVSGIKKPTISPGESQWVIKDPTPKARLLWDDQTQPQIRGMAYLRVFALPHIVLEDNRITFTAEDLNSLRQVDSGFDPNRSFAWVVRRPLGIDAVLSGDGAIGIELPDLLGDAQGNRFQTGIDESPRAYRINLEPTQDQDDRIRPEWTEVPPELEALPWSGIENPAWRSLSASRAAEAIREFLDERCRYDLENLPTPAPGKGGMLRTFLFGSTEERRGHCQYFSVAAAVMLRRLGHPTRCVAGFASDEQDAEGYIFRGLNAHAWLEVRERDGTWLRVDPTPAQNLRTAGVDFTNAGNEPPVPGHVEIKTYQSDPAELAPVRSQWWSVCLGAVLLVALIHLVKRRAARIQVDPHQAELDRQNGNLVRLATQLGVEVAPHTTLSELAKRLSERTGIDLGKHLEAHLAARFGNGPLPPPWPIAELRAAQPVRKSSYR